MSTHPHQRPFLDVTEAEVSADLGAFKDTLAEAARDAVRLGLPDVKEHLDAALDGAEQAEGKGEA